MRIIGIKPSSKRYAIPKQFAFGKYSDITILRFRYVMRVASYKFVFYSLISLIRNCYIQTKRTRQF